MFAARDQENVAFRQRQGAALKSQQGQTKTPGPGFSKTPLKVPLNDENTARLLTAKAGKNGERAIAATPMVGPQSRAILGDKTTNAKAKGLQSVNVKSTVKQFENSQAKLQRTQHKNTVRRAKNQAQAETQKLQVHAEETGQLSDEEVEYCPPKPKDLPYDSDVFPDGVITFDPLKPENRMRGYYRYYHSSKSEMEEPSKCNAATIENEVKAQVEEILAELENEEAGLGAAVAVKKQDPVNTSNTTLTAQRPPTRKPFSTVTSRNAAKALSIDDTTKSWQRKAATASQVQKAVHKKSASTILPGCRTTGPTSAQRSSIPKKSAAVLEATSRSTIGFNKGRATASMLTKGSDSSRIRCSSSMSAHASRSKVPRSDTVLSKDSDNSDKTITPARYAQERDSAADEDEQWKARVHFLSIFESGENSDAEDDKLRFHDSDNETFELLEA